MYLAAAQVAVTAALLSHHGTVTVRPGDTLSSIAAADCGTPAAYPALAAASGITNPDRIWPGQRVNLTGCDRPALTAVYAPRHAAYAGRHRAGGKVWGVAYGYPNRCGDGDGDGWDVPCATRHHADPPAAGRHAYRAAVASAGTYSYAGLEQLWQSAGGPAYAAPQAARIAECESGGRPSAYNPSGATGLWQILGQVVGGNLYDPYTNALNAVAKYRASGNTFAQWVCR